MKKDGNNATKQLYNELRVLSCEQLWEVEVPRFDAGSAKERMDRVALVRAVGVVFSESGTAEQKGVVRAWLVRLLQDPCEKIRRYAMTALPKVGAGPREEAELISLLRTTTVEREKKFLGETFDKIGGAATLQILKGNSGFSRQTEQKVKASVARAESPSVLHLESVLSNFSGLRIHLRGRAGLEKIVRDEVDAFIAKKGKFRVAGMTSGLVALVPVAPFSLGDIYTLRCFGTVGFVLGTARGGSQAESVESLASLIVSPLSRRILEEFTRGSIRYRLDFVSKGHQRGAVRLIANRAYALCPEILNDARSAPWSVNIYSTQAGDSVELSPRLVPDPRLFYRQDDVPAASHPPLAACMARLAGPAVSEIVWDPFCGSGLELIERALLGGVRTLYGTDRSDEALSIARRNFAAANLGAVEANFACCDFRDFATVPGLGRDAVSLIVTNPPMGRRVPIGDIRVLIEDLFSVAATALKPGGRLVFANPLRTEIPHPSLKLESSQVVDFSGFGCRVERYRKVSVSAKR